MCRLCWRLLLARASGPCFLSRLSEAEAAPCWYTGDSNNSRSWNHFCPHLYR